MSFPKVNCPDCGWTYPYGTVAFGSEILDPIVESGGRSLHPAECRRSPNMRLESARGLYQQMPSTWR